MIGSVGEGKSSLCNVLAGKDHNSTEFPTRPNQKEITVSKFVNWHGTGEKILLIDTPGLDMAKEKAKVDETFCEITNELKRQSDLQVFAIVLNGTNIRIDQSRKRLVRKLKETFGQEFLENNIVFVITHWHLDKASLDRRKRVRQDETLWQNSLNKTLQDFGRANPIGVRAVFIDVRHGDEIEEVEKFHEAIEELKTCFDMFPSYSFRNLQSPNHPID